MRHIYIHVPFCARRCVYCDFAIAVRREIPADVFVAALLSEHQRWVGDEAWDDEPLCTLYLGGGTPSLLPPRQLKELIQYFTHNASHRDLEVTVEANPDDISPDVARAWVAAGINRVSVGAQSFDDRFLEWMHRTHRSGDVARAVATLRTAGIRSISLDLIFARPDNIDSDFLNDLEQAIRLNTDHLSVYGLTIESQTALAHQVHRDEVIPCSESRYADEFLQAHDVLTSAGYEHYEVSNYAKPDARSRHNSAYWSGQPYAGLGPSAHSLVGNVRRWNVRHWAAYERALREGSAIVAGMETLSPTQVRLEQLYLGLRTAAGVAADLVPINGRVVDAGRARGWFDQAAEKLPAAQNLRLTARGWLRLDELCVALTAQNSKNTEEP